MNWPARGAFCALVLLCVVPLIALMAVGGTTLGLDAFFQLLQEPVVQRAFRFTLIQAVLSTALSLMLAVPVLLALRDMRSARAASALRVLFALPLVLPQIVAALAIIGVFGQNGWASVVIGAAGLGWPSIYGLGGILLAHVFFNMPLAVRVFDQALNALPPEYDKSAAQLGLSNWQRFKLIEWPTIRSAVGGVATLIFLLCATSFTIVLILGGGPRSTTLEVAIYQALTFDFDIARAILLIILQLLLTGVVAITLAPRTLGDGGSSGFGVASGHLLRYRMAGTQPASGVSLVIRFSALGFVGLPFAFLWIDGLVTNPLSVWMRSAVIDAVLTSVAIGLTSSLVACVLALAMVSGSEG
ncbi:MAG: ABC transporter permease subunit, partial [Pseudomonadota bacterium]